MPAKRIVVRLDVRDGRLDISEASRADGVSDDAIEAVRFFSAAGADEILLIDYDETAGRLETITALTRKIVRVATVPVSVSLDLDSAVQVRSLLRAGMERVVLGTRTVRKPELIGKAAAMVGRERIGVRVEAKRREVAPDGDAAGGPGDDSGAPMQWPAEGDATIWYEAMIERGNQGTGKGAVSWAVEAAKLGAGEVLIGSQDRHKLQGGFDVTLTQRVCDLVPVPVVATGGAGAADHFVEVLGQTKAAGAAGSTIFHYRETSIRRIKRACNRAGIDVREAPGDDDGTTMVVPRGSLPDADVPTPPGPAPA
jgi:cyclase